MSHEKKSGIKSVLIGAAFSVTVTLILVLIIAAVYYFADINETVLNVLLFSVSAVSAFLGGLFSSKHSGDKGLLHGLLTSLVYLIVLFAAAFAVNKQLTPAPRLITLLIAGSAAGMLGGIFGVNS